MTCHDCDHATPRPEPRATSQRFNLFSEILNLRIGNRSQAANCEPHHTKDETMTIISYRMHREIDALISQAFGQSDHLEADDYLNLTVDFAQRQQRQRSNEPFYLRQAVTALTQALGIRTIARAMNCEPIGNSHKASDKVNVILRSHDNEQAFVLAFHCALKLPKIDGLTVTGLFKDEDKRLIMNVALTAM